MRLLIALALAASLATAEIPCVDRWVYCPVNCQVDERVDDLIALFARAEASGYNGVLVTDYKFGRLADRPANYTANLAQIRAAATAHRLALHVAVMPMGYSSSLLQNDPNLAEGLPVVAAPFRVTDGLATVVREELLPFGDAEKDAGSKIDGWQWCDGFGTSVVRDPAMKHGGTASWKLTDFAHGNEAGNCRLVSPVAVTPHRQYHLSLWIRTQDLDRAGDVRVAVLTKGGGNLTHADLGVQRDQDWTEHHVVFNSLDQEQVNVYVGLWGGRGGTLWIDDVRLSACGGVNLLRREGCPLVVTDSTGTTTYEEGTDFARWEAPTMGRVPWPGEYEVWHPEPPLRLLPDSRIAAGQTLAVSYFHTVTVLTGQVAACLSHDRVFELMETEILGLQRQLKPDGWFMSLDELRVARYCTLCAASPDAGTLVADHLTRSLGILQRVAPGRPVTIWSDMVDPHHNAHAGYYLVDGDLAGSWEGLPPAVRIANWNSGQAAESLAFFANRGHHQLIAGYYDDPNVAGAWQRWAAAATGVKAVDGVMYTTWNGGYDRLEDFARAVGFHP